MISEQEKNKILDAVKDGKAYAYLKKIEIRWNSTKSDVYVFPITDKNIEKRIISLCDNATVFLTKDYALLQKKIKCKNELSYEGKIQDPIKKIFVIKNGELHHIKDICKTCKYMVDELVGECREKEYKSDDGKIYDFEINEEIKNYLKIKPGYIRTQEFSTEVDFSLENVKERIEYYEKKGQWRKQLNSTRKNICANCVKYRTHTCKKGYSGYKTPVKCHYTKEDLMKRLKEECITDFGSLGRAFWYFSQCGKLFDYRDPISKRVSERYISVPGHPEGYDNAKGFFLSFARYPFEIGSYGYRERHRHWRKEKDVKKKHINYLSEHEYKKHHQKLLKKTRYKKEYEELLLTAYAVYKHIGSTPGQSYFMDSYSNYLVYIGIKGKEVEVGIGASKWKWSRTLKGLEDLFNTTVFNIEKI
jgi:hypothetical protein